MQPNRRPSKFSASSHPSILASSHRLEKSTSSIPIIKALMNNLRHLLSNDNGNERDAGYDDGDDDDDDVVVNVTPWRRLADKALVPSHCHSVAIHRFSVCI